jgi:hypothetical protein
MAEMFGSIWLLTKTKIAKSTIPTTKKYDRIGIRIAVSRVGLYNANAGGPLDA